MGAKVSSGAWFISGKVKERCRGYRCEQCSRGARGTEVSGRHWVQVRVVNEGFQR